MPPLLFAPPCLAILPLCFSIHLLPPSSLAILPLRFSIHLLPPSSLAILPLRFSIHFCHRPVWQFSRFVFRCHGGEPPPARLFAYANTPLPPLRALNRRARNARALPILSHRALRSAPYLVCSLFPQMNNTTRKFSIIAHCSRPPRLC